MQLKILLFSLIATSLCAQTQNSLTSLPYIIRHVKKSDIAQLKETYQLVAQTSQNIALMAHEVTDEYITHIVDAAITNGLGLIVELDGQLIGWMLKQRYDFASSRHVLYGGNISVHPHYQGQGIGTKLISEFLDEVQRNHPDILRVEIYALESNPAFRLYQRLGFEVEGILKNGKLHPDESLESYYFMVWFNPNYKYARAGAA